MNDQTTAPAETVVTAAPAAPKVRNLAEVQAYVLEAISHQNAITVVSAEIVEVKADGKRGKRVELILSGDGVGDPTRRYFLRENSAFASAIAACEGLVFFAPKKARGSDHYQLNFGMNEAIVSYVAPAPAKEPKTLLTPEERKERRLAGKRAAAERRAQEAAAAAANAPAEPKAIAA